MSLRLRPQSCRSELAKKNAINLLDLRPRRNLASETLEDGLVVLLVPKFKNRPVVKWLVPRLSKPNFRVKLDAYGSFIWQQLDGAATVGEIAERLRSRFGEAVEPHYQRTGQFVQRLLHSKFVDVNDFS